MKFRHITATERILEISQTVSHRIKIDLSFRVNKLKIRFQETQKTKKKIT